MTVLKKKLLERFMKRIAKNKLQKEFRFEKVIKKKDNKFYVKWKWYNSSFNSWIDNKDIVSMSKYFPELKYLGRNVKVESDLSSYATKANSKNGTGVDISDVSKNANLVNLKSDVDKLHIDRLKNLPSNLSNSKNK